MYNSINFNLIQFSPATSYQIIHIESAEAGTSNRFESQSNTDVVKLGAYISFN
jgi:hypothetical protein